MITKRGRSGLPSYVRLFMIGAACCIMLFNGCKRIRTSVQVHPLEVAAGKFNASCPKMIDADTRLDSAFFIPDSMFRYDYTLVNYDVEQIDAEGLALYLKSRIRSNVRMNPDMKIQRDHQATMIFYYRDRKGAFVTQVVLTPQEY